MQTNQTPCVFETCSVLLISSETLKCRLLTLLLDHPTGVCDKNTPPEKGYALEYYLSAHRVRGWRAVSAEGLQGEDSPKNSIILTDTDMKPRKHDARSRGALPRIDVTANVYGYVYQTPMFSKRQCLCFRLWPRLLLRL